MISVLPFRTASLEERFWAKVRRLDEDACWLWLASTSGSGYGQFFVHKAEKRPYMALAHRASYELEVGSIPEGLTIDHLCKNKLCVNPSHLEVVTMAENLRRVRHYNLLKTACPRGHPYDKEDVWMRKDGRIRTGRRCSVCRREQESKRHS